MPNSRPVSVPLETLSKSESEHFPGSPEPVTDVPYRQAVGSIMYLIIGTRPDFAFAIGMLSQFTREIPAATLDSIAYSKKQLSHLAGVYC